MSATLEENPTPTDDEKFRNKSKADTLYKQDPSGTEDNKGNKIDLDTILVEEIGQFGWFQLRVLVLTIVVVIFAAWSASEYVFTTARISTRCLIPECEAAGGEWSPAWLGAAIPGGGTDNCQRFAPASSTNVSSDTASCPAELFDQSTLQGCAEYVYENTDTVVYDFGLACDEWRRTLIGSMRTLGTLLALPITGYISDRWGRRVALAVNAVNTAWLGIVRYWAATLAGFIVSEVVESTLGSGGFSSAYILLMEVVGPKYRVAAGATMNTFFSIGQILMGLIVWAVPNWQLFTLAIYIPQLLTVAYFWVMTESVRWYMSKGRYEESEALIRKIARTNRRTLSPKSLKALRQSTEEEKRNKLVEKDERAKEPWLIVLVFRHKKILLRCAVSSVWWITNIFVYYGLSINSVNISGDRYINYIAVAAVDIPGYWSAVLLMGRVGRKPVLIAAFWLCAACQVAFIFLPDGYYALSLTFYLIGKYCIAIVMTSVYVYTAELYPTKYRHSLFAFSSMMGRIGAIVAPLTPAFGDATFEEFPFVLFGSFALLSGILMFLTPETLGTKLPDTMEEAEALQLVKDTKTHGSDTMEK